MTNKNSSPIFQNKSLDASYNSVTPDIVDNIKYLQINRANGNYSESNSNVESSMPQNSPKQHTNEGKLIKKLADKQKMLEKYEQMLQKVNVEFQNTLTKNKELADKVSSLESRCLRAEENASSLKGKVNGDQYTVQRQLDELILEKDDLQSDNVSLNKLLKNKNYEIEEFQKIKTELENRLVSHSTEHANVTKNEVEYVVVIDQLKKHVLDLEFELTKKDEDYRIDVANCDLIAQSLKTENDQMTIQRNELNEQNTKYKEQIWKDTLLTRQVTNENENLKRENMNLKNTAELTLENEYDYVHENKYLRDTSLAAESKCLAYQNIITQNDKLDLSVVENLERSLGLLRSSEEINRRLVTVNIQRIIDETRSFRIRIKNKLDVM
jgi:hypothetical protein